MRGICKSVKILLIFLVYSEQVTTVPFIEQEAYCATLLSQYDPYLLDLFKWEMSQGVKRFFLLSYCLSCCWAGLGPKSDLNIVKQWAEVDFVYPSPEDQSRAYNNQYYIRGSSVLIDVDFHSSQGPKGSRIFVSNPRFGPGRPITFGTVERDGKIKAYPDYSWHDNQGQNCAGMTSVFRSAIDECQRLWVMDTGKIGDTQSCPPQLLAFDLTTDKLIYRHVLNESSYTDASIFITPVVDVRPRGVGDCASTFVYVADVNGFAMIVVDVLNNRSWKITHRLFYPYPSRGVFYIDGERFELMDGIFGMALSPFKPDNERNLFFHSLAATTENVVNTRVIRNASYAESGQLDIDSAIEFREQRSSQSAAQAMDRNGILFFGLMSPPSIWCWNSATDFSPRNFHSVAVDQETLQFASGMKVITNTNGEQELWILTSSFQRVMTGTISPNRVNFRIHVGTISTLLQNSPCRERKHKPGYH